MLIRLLKPLSFLPAILLMYMIFSFSAQDAETSSALSYRVSYRLVETGDRILSLNMDTERIAHIAERCEWLVRKMAHVTEYFLLAIAVAFPFYVYGLHGIALMIVAGFICVAFAGTDEYHQSFVDGRSPALRDVAIDSIGIFFGVIIVRIVGWTGRMTIFRPFSRKKRKYRQEKPERGQNFDDEPYEEENDEEELLTNNSDSLSEDMSLRKLFHDLTSKKD